MFQIGQSIQQDATRSKGWLSTIQRTCSEAGRFYWAKVVASGLRGVSASDGPEKLVSIASRANLEELEEMVRQIELIYTSSSPMLTNFSPSVLQILSLRPHAPAVRWLVDIKRAATTAHGNGLPVTRNMLFPDFAWATQNIKPSEISSLKFTSLFNQIIMALTKILDSVDPDEVATIVALHYTRNQALYLIVFLTMEAYDVPVAKDWAGVSAQSVFEALVDTILLLDTGLVSPFSICFSDLLTPDEEALVWRNKKDRSEQKGSSRAQVRSHHWSKGVNDWKGRSSKDAALPRPRRRTFFLTKARAALARLGISYDDPSYRTECRRLYVDERVLCSRPSLRILSCAVDHGGVYSTLRSSHHALCTTIT